MVSPRPSRLLLRRRRRLCLDREAAAAAAAATDAAHNNRFLGAPLVRISPLPFSLSACLLLPSCPRPAFLPRFSRSVYICRVYEATGRLLPLVPLGPTTRFKAALTIARGARFSLPPPPLEDGLSKIPNRRARDFYCLFFARG